MMSQKLTLTIQVEEKLCKVPDVQASLSIVDGIDEFLQFVPHKPIVVSNAITTRGPSVLGCS